MLLPRAYAHSESLCSFRKLVLLPRAYARAASMSRELQVARLQALLPRTDLDAVPLDTSAFGDVGDVVPTLQPRKVTPIPFGQRVSVVRLNERPFDGDTVVLVFDPADRTSGGHVTLEVPRVNFLDGDVADHAAQLFLGHVLWAGRGRE